MLVDTSTAAFVTAIAVVAVAERWRLLQFHKGLRIFRAGIATDGIYLLTSLLLATVVAVFILPAALAFQGAWLTATRSLVEVIPPPLRVLLAVVVLDLGIFCAHRYFHRQAFWWRLHQVHHSSPQLDMLATFRSHPLGQLLLKLLCPLALIALGFGHDEILVAGAIYNFFAMFTHANVDIPWFPIEYVLCTPRMHRLHHTKRGAGCNFGTIFSFWDRALGSLVLEDANADTVFGVPGRSRYPGTWLSQIRDPFVARPKLHEAPQPTQPASSASSSESPSDAA